MPDGLEELIELEGGPTIEGGRGCLQEEVSPEGYNLMSKRRLYL